MESRSQGDINIGRMLKFMRIQRNIAQDEIAELTGVSRSMISHIEVGMPSRLSADMKVKLAEIFDLDEGWFDRIKAGDFGQDGPPSFIDDKQHGKLLVTKDPQSNTSLFGQLVMRQRIGLLINQPSLAEATGIDKTDISKLERGELDRISIIQAMSLVDALNIPHEEVPELTQKYAEYEEQPEEEIEKRHKRICYKFRQERRKRGVKLTELAERANLNKGNLSKIETAYSNKARLWASTMSLLTETLGLKPEWFDEEYRRVISEVDFGSWLCPFCLRVWSRYRVKCECGGANGHKFPEDITSDN